MRLDPQGTVTGRCYADPVIPFGVIDSQNARRQWGRSKGTTAEVGALSEIRKRRGVAQW